MKQLDVVITTLNSQYIHASLAPWCLKAGLGAYGDPAIHSEVVEGTVNEPVAVAAQRILAFRPQVVGLSCYIWNIGQTEALIRQLRQSDPLLTIVVGGPEVSYCAERVFSRNPDVDFLIAGEGERPFALLCNALLHGNADGFSNPAVMRRGGAVAAPCTPNDVPPSPYSPEALKSFSGRIAYLETSRGCPFRCAFCLSGRCGSVRYYPLERAKRELLLLAASGARVVKLVDRTFNANRARALLLFQYILENYGGAIPAGMCFHFEIAGDLLEEETLSCLAKAPVGSMQFEIGLQSFFPDTLEAVCRKTDLALLERNIRRLLLPGNVHVHVDLIAGLPLEDYQRFSDSFNRAFSLRPHMLQLGFLKRLFGSPMEESPARYPGRFCDAAPYEVQDTPWLSERELDRLRKTAFELDRLYNSGRFHTTLQYALEASRLSPFSIFSRIADAMDCKAGASLDQVTAVAYVALSALPGVDPARLRDALLFDRLCVNPSCQIPAILRIEDPLLKNVRNRLRALGYFPSDGTRHCEAILYTEGAALVVCYGQKHPVTGVYQSQKVPLSLLFPDAALSAAHCDRI